jgi:peptidylprolyl isomerase
VNLVLRRSRRPALFLATIALATTLAACGDDVVTADEGPSEHGFDAFTVSGDLGTEPKITWNARMDVDEIESKTLIEGDGAELEEGSRVMLKFVIGNGTTQRTSYSSYGGAQASGEIVEASDQLPEVFADALIGHTIGSRVAVISTAEDAFGEQGNPQLGVGNKDTFVLVADLVTGVRSKPTGKRNPAPAWVPDISEKDGEPTALDFGGTPEPTGKLQQATLIAGTGPQVEKGQTVIVNYLGQVYDGAKPFDEIGRAHV